MGHHSRDLHLLRLAAANHTYTDCPPPQDTKPWSLPGLCTRRHCALSPCTDAHPPAIQVWLMPLHATAEHLVPSALNL